MMMTGVSDEGIIVDSFFRMQGAMWKALLTLNVQGANSSSDEAPKVAVQILEDDYQVANAQQLMICPRAPASKSQLRTKVE